MVTPKTRSLNRAYRRHRLASPRLRTALAAVTLFAACGEQTESGSQPLQLDPYASVIAPPSLIDEIVLLEGERACVIDTYWYRVVCTDPGGDSFRFGREGEGPGEFTDPTEVLRGPAGMIGVVDPRSNRLSMFLRSGEFVASTPGLQGIPGILTSSGPSATGGTMATSFRKFGPDRRSGSSTAQAEIDTATGRVVWERTFPDEADVVNCSTPRPGSPRRQMGTGYDDGDGGLVFVTCYGEFLVWYADRDADEPGAIVRTTYVERYPTDEDVASELRFLNSIPSGGFRPDVDEEDIRARPKAWYGARVVDDECRFWAVSHWNSSDVTPSLSYIDMFRLTDTGPGYALTLQVADKVVGMDVLGNALAVLVERETGGVVRERRVDWYDVTDVAPQR